MTNPSILSVYSFFQQAEKLKLVMRHAWAGPEAKQESTAEHTWMLCLMAMTLFNCLEMPVDQLKTLKMLIVHDLAEAIAGDIPYFEEGVRREGKEKAERDALAAMTAEIGVEIRDEILSLWEEFEAAATAEAKVCRAIDKYEALFSHAQARFDTWGEGDYKIAFGKDDELFAFDPFIKQLKDQIDRVNYDRIKEAGALHRLDPTYLARYFPEDAERA